MMLTKHVLVAILPFYIAAVNAANDWSKPCTSGVCEWDVDNGDTSGNIVVTAATSALSDITSAAGWHILDCDPNSLDSQTIRLVCESADVDEAGCNAIDEDGPENTVVRLPNSCGGGPFARLVRIWNSENQSIPEEARRKFRKRTVTAPGTVKNAIIDFDFAAVPPKNNVEILATGSNNPAAPVHEQAARIRRAHSSQKMRRGLGSRAPADVVSGFLNKLGDLTKAGVSTLGNSPIKIKKNIPIVANSKTCPATATTPALQGGFNMNVDVDIDARVNYGFAVEGKLVPPTIANVGFFTDLSGNASAIFHVVASAEAKLDSGRIDAGTFPLSPLSIPGVVNIGPALSLGVSGLATLGITGKMDVGTRFELAKIEMRFPPKQGPSEGKVVAVNAPLTLDVSPQVELGGSLEGHLTPRLTLGVDLLNGFARANVFVDVDMSGTLNMGVKAVAKATTAKPATANPATAKPATDTKPTTNISGCVGLNSGIAARAGTDGVLPGFFDKTTAIPIFQKEFELFKKCFGVPTEPAPATGPKAPAALNPGKAPPVVDTSKQTASGTPGTNSGLNDAAKIGDKLRAPTTGAKPGTVPAGRVPTAPTPPGVNTGAKAPTTPVAQTGAKAPTAPVAQTGQKTPTTAPPKTGKTARSLESPTIAKRAISLALACPGTVSALTRLVSQ